MTRNARSTDGAVGSTWWSCGIDRRLAAAFAACHARVEAVHPAAVQVSAVPLPEEFNKRRTNLLIHHTDDQVRAYVDFDLALQGNNSRLQAALSGPEMNKWKELTIKLPPADAGQVVRDVLKLLQSPVMAALDIIPAWAEKQRRPTLHPNSMLATETRPLSANELATSFRKSLHKPLARKLAVALTRQPPQACLVWGPPGVGKGELARSAAHVLVRRGAVRSVRYLPAARLTRSRVTPAARDAAISALLDELADQPGVLLLADNFDLAISGAYTGFGILCDGIDRGARLLATVQHPELLRDLQRSPALARRLLPVRVPHPSRRETLKALEQFARHCGCDVAPAALLAAVEITERQQGTQPAAAIELLSAAVAAARWRTKKQITPDDLTSVPHPQWPE